MIVQFLNRLNNSNMNAVPDVDGLFLQKDFVTAEQEKSIIGELDGKVWSTKLKRRTQHYGYEYDYTNKGADLKSRVVDPLSTCQWIDGIATVISPLFPNEIKPDQCIVNEYTREQGIAAHTDSPKFGPVIASISLGSPTNFIFELFGKPGKVVEVPARSLLLLTGPARYEWTHCIPQGKKTISVDNKRTSKPFDYRRVSLTYRTVL